MTRNKIIKEQITEFGKLNEATDTIEEKLKELEALLTASDLDSEKIKYYKKKIDDSLDNHVSIKQKLEAYQFLDNEADLSQNDRLDKLMNLLSELPVDSKIPQQLKKHNLPQKIALIVIALLMIILGFAMIILPAPPDFEMFTIFYFNRDDGVTLMDLISLLIVFTGIFLLISNIRRK